MGGSAIKFRQTITRRSSQTASGGVPRFVDGRTAQFRHVHHVQLIDVAGDDAQKAKPLEQRYGVIFDQREDPALKGQETQFEVDLHVGG